MESVPGGDTARKIPAVCARSFFNGILSRRRKAHRSWTTAAVTLILVLVLTGVLIKSQAGFAVYMDGEPIGSARSIDEVTAIVAGAEEQLRELLGPDYTLDKSITVTAALAATQGDTEQIKNAIIGGADGVVELYVLEVNGTPVGAAENESVLDGVLVDIIEKYSTPLTTSVRFADSVVISRRFINQDITTDPQVIRSLLEPENGASDCCLTVESTERCQYTEEVAFNVVQYEDGEAYEGSAEVITQGVPGETLVTESVVCLNGQERSRQVIGTVLTRPPVDEVIAIGTAPRPKTASYGRYIWPADGIMTSGFGPRTGFGSSNHQGIDIAASYGEPIMAADGGEVIMAEYYYGYGLLLQVRHDNGDITYYGHCAEVMVGVGDRVYQGQVIALMGATGVASGVHCHFELRINDTPVDPMKHLP